MKFNVLLFSLILIIAFGCSRMTDSGEVLETIHLKESSDVLPISTFIKNIDYVELEISSGNVTAGEIQDVKNMGNDLIIKNRRAGETSYWRFSKEGRFLNEIINNRNDEIADIVSYHNDFAVLGEKAVQIVSKKGDLKERMYEEEIPGKSFLNLDNRFFVLNESAPFGLLHELRGNRDKITGDEVYDKQIVQLGFSGISHLGKGEYHILSCLNDTVFKFSKDGLEPRYRIDGDPYPTFSQVLQKSTGNKQAEIMKSLQATRYVMVKNYLENKNFIFISYLIGSNSNNMLINKKSGQILYFARGINNIDGGIWDKPIFLSDNNELYIPLSAYKILGHKVSNKKQKGFEKLQTKIQSSNNPVIMRCKLKQ
jgi:hypothetical protein